MQKCERCGKEYKNETEYRLKCFTDIEKGQLVYYHNCYKDEENN